MRKYELLVTISDNNNTDYKHEVAVKVNVDDYFTLKDYEMEDYDNAWDRLCKQIENTGEPDDWFIDGIKFMG
jgi:hypothetical protein